MRTKTRNAFPHHHPLLPRLNFTYNSSASSPLSDIRERRMGVVDSLHHFVFAAPSFSLSSLAPSGCDTFTNCSGMGPSHEPQFIKNCSNMCLYHGVHPSGKDCSSMGPPWAAAPTRTAPPWVYSPQAALLAMSLLLQGLSTSCSLPLGISTCCSMGSSMGCCMEICSHAVLHWLQGDSLLYCGLSTGCGRHLVVLAPRAPLPLLLYWRGCLYGYFSLLVLLVLLLYSTFNPFLNIFSKMCHRCL